MSSVTGSVMSISKLRSLLIWNSERRLGKNSRNSMEKLYKGSEALDLFSRGVGRCAKLQGNDCDVFEEGGMEPTAVSIAAWLNSAPAASPCLRFHSAR